MSPEDFAKALNLSPEEIAEGIRLGEAVVAHFDQVLLDLRCDTGSLAAVWLAEGLNRMRREIGNHETALWCMRMAMMMAKATDLPTTPTSGSTH